MKKIFPFIMVAIALAALCSHAQASERRTRFSAAIDYLTASGIEDHFTVGATDNQRKNASGGWGIRAAAYRPNTTGRFEVGASIGYIHGPNVSVDGDISSPPPPFSSPISLNSDIDLSFIRVLGEAAFFVPLRHQTRLRFGGGVGAAQGKIERSYRERGGSSFSRTDSETSIDPTGELSASII